MRPILIALLAVTLSACGGGPRPPDWKQDSASLIERFKKAELKGQNKLAEGYFEQAIAAVGSAAKIDEAARLHLVRCATRQASLSFEPCSGYLELARYGANAEDETYFRFISGKWDNLDAGKLPAQYRDFLANRDPAKNAELLRKINDPLSRLIAVSITVMRKQADDPTLALATETAAEQGWRKPLLVYLKLLENRAVQKGDQAEIEKLRARIRLVEGTL